MKGWFESGLEGDGTKMDGLQPYLSPETTLKNREKPETIKVWDLLPVNL